MHFTFASQEGPEVPHPAHFRIISLKILKSFCGVWVVVVCGEWVVCCLWGMGGLLFVGYGWFGVCGEWVV